MASEAGNEADNELEESATKAATADFKPRTGTGRTHRSSDRPVAAMNAPQIARTATPRIVNIPAGRGVAATLRPAKAPVLESNKHVGGLDARTQRGDAGYDADKSSMASSTWQPKDGPPVCNGCGRLFCMGKTLCWRQGDGTPGWRRWRPKTKAK